MKRRPPRSTRTDTLVPDTTLCRSPKVQSTRTVDSPAQNANVDPDHRQAQGKQTKAEAEGDDGGGHFAAAFLAFGLAGAVRSEEHTSELQSLMRLSDAVFCLKKKINTGSNTQPNTGQYLTDYH